MKFGLSEVEPAQKKKNVVTHQRKVLASTNKCPPMNTGE